MKFPKNMRECREALLAVLISILSDGILVTVVLCTITAPLIYVVMKDNMDTFIHIITTSIKHIEKAFSILIDAGGM